MKRNQGRVLTAMALAVVLALTCGTAFADGGGNDPFPAQSSASTYSVDDGGLGFLLDATAAVLNLV